MKELNASRIEVENKLRETKKKRGRSAPNWHMIDANLRYGEQVVPVKKVHFYYEQQMSFLAHHDLSAPKHIFHQHRTWDISDYRTGIRIGLRLPYSLSSYGSMLRVRRMIEDFGLEVFHEALKSTHAAFPRINPEYVEVQGRYSTIERAQSAAAYQHPCSLCGRVIFKREKKNGVLYLCGNTHHNGRDESRPGRLFCPECAKEVQSV